MLTKEKKLRLRNTNMFVASYKEVDGTPYLKQKPINIPDVWEIRREAMRQIQAIGFANIEPIEPKNANCIIRIFTKRHFEYENEEIHNVYGFQCFVKENGIWISEMGKILQINFKKCEIIHFLLPNESVEYSCDFIDCYVKIS